MLAAIPEVPEMRPPTITIAKGRCESEPIACDRAAGNSPRVATRLVVDAMREIGLWCKLKPTVRSVKLRLIK